MGRRCTAAQGGRAMTGATRRITMIVLVLAVCAGPWGCAIKRPPGPQSPTDEVRAELKTIGLPVAGFVPEAQVDAPTSGKAMGALKGAGFGLAAGATPGMAIVEGVGKVGTACGAARELGALVCGAVVALGLGVAAAGGTVGALGGTVYGAVTAESGSKIDAAETELKSAVTQSNVQATLRDHVLQTVRDRSSLNFVAVDDHQTSAAGERIDYGALVSTDIDTVLEVSVPRIGLVAQSGINPPVSLFMTAGARLIRAADGAGGIDRAARSRDGLIGSTRTDVRNGRHEQQRRAHARSAAACGARDMARNVQAGGGKWEVSRETADLRGEWRAALGTDAQPRGSGSCRLRRRLVCGHTGHADRNISAEPWHRLPAGMDGLSADRRHLLARQHRREPRRYGSGSRQPDRDAGPGARARPMIPGAPSGSGSAGEQRALPLGVRQPARHVEPAEHGDRGVEVLAGLAGLVAAPGEAAEAQVA